MTNAIHTKWKRKSSSERIRHVVVGSLAQADGATRSTMEAATTEEGMSR